jgi:hypothetical protein
MHKYTKEIYEYDGDIFHVITEPGKNVAIFEDEIGYDVTGMTEVFDGEVLEEREIRTLLNFEEYTHEFACNFKKIK